jgi:flagellin
MVQTAEGALNEVHSMLQRIRELAVEAGNATIGQSDAQNINAEVTALQDEITRIGNTTTFNGTNLLTGTPIAQTGGTLGAGYVADSGTNTSVQSISVAGAKASTTYTLTTGAAGAVTLTAGGSTQTVTAGGVAAKGTATLNFDKLGISITVASVAGATAAQEQGIAGGGTGTTIITGAATGLTAVFQIGANAGDTLGVNFADSRSTALGMDTAISDFTTAANSAPATIAAKAGALITATDAAIASVSTIRANFGAVQNRLQHTVASISVASENLNASRSRIRDLDVAAEMVNFTKTQILQQAGTAILAQANSAPQNVLTLLR